MRIRSLKPGFWISEDIARLDEVVALHYMGLWSYAQDNGVGRDDPRLLKAALYPLRAKVTVAEVMRRQQALVATRLIVRYEENGVALFYIPAWDSHQRVVNPARCHYGRPTVPVTSLYAAPNEEVASPSLGTNEGLARASALELGVGRRGGEEGMELGCRSLEVGKGNASLRSVFDHAWGLYPKRADNSKAKAWRAWQARVKAGTTPEVLLAGVERYAAFVVAEGTDPKFIKMASTFFGPDEHYLNDYTSIDPDATVQTYLDNGEINPVVVAAFEHGARVSGRRS